MKLFTYLKNPSESRIIIEYAKDVFEELNTTDFNSGESLIKECKNAGKEDLLLIDMILSFDDIEDVLSRIRGIGCEIKIVVLAGVESEILIDKAIEAGGDYVALKPYILKELFETIQSLMKGEFKLDKQCDSQVFVKRSMIEKVASKVLTDCGILPNVKGFRYLKFAAKEGFFDFSVIDGITKNLYPLLAMSFDTSTDKVERAIRHAIEVAWKKDKFNSGFEKLGFSKEFYTKRPKNSEFVYALVEYVKNIMVE